LPARPELRRSGGGAMHVDAWLGGLRDRKMAPARARELELFFVQAQCCFKRAPCGREFLRILPGGKGP